MNTPPVMFANGTVGTGGPYDGIVTLSSAAPFQFTRPISPDTFDAQRATEHEMDEVMGFASHAAVANLRPQDLFSWSSAAHRTSAPLEHAIFQSTVESQTSSVLIKIRMATSVIGLAAGAPRHIRMCKTPLPARTSLPM